MGLRFVLNRLLPTYSGVWIFIMICHFLFITLTFKIEIPLASVETLTFFLLYFVLGIGIWFVVVYTESLKIDKYNFFIRHITAITLIVFLWIHLSYMLMETFVSADEAYSLYLQQTKGMRVIEGVGIYLFFALIFYLIYTNENLKDRNKREQELETLLKQSEINTLKAQIKPHFLFNSLNSISSLTITNPEKAQEMVINLSEFMRYSLNNTNDNFTTLKNELHHVRLYLQIESVRFVGRLHIEEQVNENTLAFPVPSMILQPLIENAVKYGVYNNLGMSTIQLKSYLHDDYLHISIVNNYENDMPSNKGTGKGLENIAARLRMIYGMTDLIETEKQQNIFSVYLKFPPHAA